MFAPPASKSAAAASSAWAKKPTTASTMLTTLANLPEHPESVPINMLIPISGTPLADAEPIAPIDFVRIDRAGQNHDAAIAWCGCRPAAPR